MCIRDSPTRIPALSANNLAADGCPDAINAKGNSFGPSWRMIVHQKNPVEAYGVYPGGQSGNPFSPYYKNMVNEMCIRDRISVTVGT